MRESLKMLAEIDIATLKQAKNKKQYPQIVTQFMNQLASDFRLIVPPTHDPLKQAENQLYALQQAALSNPKLFNADALKKLELIFDIYPNKTGENVYVLNEFYQGLDTVIPMIKDKKKLKDELLTFHMKNILYANKKNDKQAVLQACCDFGNFLQQTYPGKKIEDLYALFSARKEFETYPLPKLDAIAVLVDAKAIVYYKIGSDDNPDPEQLKQVDALSKGLSIFGKLLGSERVNNSIKDLSISTEAYDDAERLVSDYVTKVADKLRTAKQLIDQKILPDLSLCKAELTKTIVAEVSQLPDYLKHRYAALDSKKTFVDVEQVCRDFETIKSSSLISKMAQSDFPPALASAVKSYLLVKKLETAVTATGQNAMVKLQNYTKIYQSKTSQATLQTSNDSKVIGVLKKLGYLIANILSFSLLHHATKGSFLDSPQQKLKRRLDEPHPVIEIMPIKPRT